MSSDVGGWGGAGLWVLMMGFSCRLTVHVGCGFLIEAEVRGLKLKIEQVLSPGEIQGTLLRCEARPLLQEIGDVVGGKGAVLQGVREGTGHGVMRVDVA